jgi:Flp pilus assembly protein TadD
LRPTDSLHLMGLLSLAANQFDHAVEWTSRAIRCDPKPLYLTSLGTALLAQARFEEALQVFDKAVQLKPDDAELWTNLGGALVKAGRPADAVLSFQQTLRLNQRHWDAACRSGLLLLDLKRYQEAIRHSSCARNCGRARARCPGRMRRPCIKSPFPCTASEGS